MAAQRYRPGTAVRLGGAAVLATIFVAALAGGLARAGVSLPLPAPAQWPARAAAWHAFLMMFAFFGTVIGVERAVALRHRGALAAPVVSAAAGLCMLGGWPAAAALCALISAALFVIVNVALCVRQPAAHTGLLLLGALALAVANVLFALGTAIDAVVLWWFDFLVLTIAAERLEMTRLMRRRPLAQPALQACLALLLAGAAAALAWPAAGAALHGAALVALACWLFTFDIARKTVRTHGLSRYMAVCLLLGYGWLVVAGLAWIGMALGLPTRDVALHALGLGFVFSMLLGHAPVILPALAGVKLEFGAYFYLPLALLHLSLVARVLGSLERTSLFGIGALGNAAAIALFAATLLGAARAWRRRHAPLRETTGA